MANKPLRPCSKPGCSVLTREGYCPEHKPVKAARRESAQWHDWYNKSIWTDDLRPAQLMRQPFCRVCLDRGFRTRATVVDHVIPFRGNWALFVDPNNHQSLCKRCHDRKTAQEQAERRKNSVVFSANVGRKWRNA